MVVMSVIVTLAPDIFKSIVDRKKIAKHPFLEHTKFSKYLPTVVMAWLAEKKITADFIISDSDDSVSDQNLIFTQVENEVTVSPIEQGKNETKKDNLTKNVENTLTEKKGDFFSTILVRKVLKI